LADPGLTTYRKTIWVVLGASIWLAVLSLGATASASVGSASKTFPGKDGLIAYQSMQASGWNIFVVNQSRTKRQLTTSPANDTQPAISPNGRRIAFVRSNGRDADIMIMNIDGTGDVERLTSGQSIDRQPTFAPDGRRIAFVSDRSGNPAIWTIRTDGTQPKRISAQPGPAANPAYSPDGSRILFEGVSYSNSPLGVDAILSVYSDSDQPQAATTRFTSFVPVLSEPGGFSVSATGNNVAFSIRTRVGITQPWNEFQLRIGGSVGMCACENAGSFPNLNLTSRRDGDATRPDFSPEGDWVAYQRSGEIYQMSTDYTRERAPEYRRMTYSQGRDSNPDWGPAAAP
jgi:Tol biopolymer transport system component